MDSGIALNCDSFCSCIGFKNSVCFFGPDDYGNFIREEGVSSELADSCDRNFCTCDTQDYPEGESYQTELDRKVKKAEEDRRK